MSSLKRKYRSTSVERDAALNTLGLLGKKINYDHRPPLSHRPRNADNTDYDPPENDPRYIYVVLAEENAALNRGNPAIPLSGDTSIAAKLKRLEKAAARFSMKRQLGMLEGLFVEPDDTFTTTGKRKRPRAKRKIPSRPFRKRKP
jgi:hypothetical protein